MFLFGGVQLQLQAAMDMDGQCRQYNPPPTLTQSIGEWTARLLRI